MSSAEVLLLASLVSVSSSPDPITSLMQKESLSRSENMRYGYMSMYVCLEMLKCHGFVDSCQTCHLTLLIPVYQQMSMGDGAIHQY
jgi:hypothetical protein